MSTLKVAIAGTAIAVLAVAGAVAAEGPNLGQPITQQELAAWDLHVGGDGKGLPAGKGTPKDGETVFAAKCQACHGEKGAGTPNDRLVGGQGTLVGDQPAVKTVGSFWPHAVTLFDYVRRAMPLTEPQSLTADEVYAVSAYILNLNGIIPADAVMNAETLPKVKMPNADKFFVVYPGNLK